MTRRLALALLGLAVCASAGAAAPGSALDALPGQIQQGSLLRARLAPGSQLELLAADGTAQPVRVGSDGGFVVGAGRDETGPLRLRLTAPEGSVSSREIAVTPREWQIERIEGVPEATVNPPPEIAARIEREQAKVSAARTRDDDRDDYEANFDWPVQGRVRGV